MCQEWKSLNGDVGKWEWRVYPSTGYSCVHILTILLLCQSESWDCCLGWKWQRAAFSQLTWGWGPEQQFVLRGVITGGLRWSGRSKVCSAFGAENVMAEETGGGHLFQQFWWYHKASSTQMHLERGLTPHSARNLHKQDNQVCGQESPHSGSKEERKDIVSSEKALISFLIWWGVACTSIHQDEWTGSLSQTISRERSLLKNPGLP